MTKETTTVEPALAETPKLSDQEMAAVVNVARALVMLPQAKAQLQDDNAKAQRRLGETQTEIQRLETDRGELIRQREQFKVEVAELRGQASDLTAAITAAREELAALKANIARHDSELAAARARLGLGVPA
jgi:septal ring factor EnvC (AmiA/AmiB activator)